jgi:hypothetical protein
MGISSPTKLQLKHIPDLVVLETIYCIQNQWEVRKLNSLLQMLGDDLIRLPGGKLTYTRKRTASLSEICEALQPLPKKLVWRKLQKLEDQRKIESYGPASIRFRVLG